MDYMGPKDAVLKFSFEENGKKTEPPYCTAYIFETLLIVSNCPSRINQNTCIQAKRISGKFFITSRHSKDVYVCYVEDREDRVSHVMVSDVFSTNLQ